MKLHVVRTVPQLLHLILRSRTPRLAARLSAALCLVLAGPIASVFSPVVLGEAINGLPNGTGAGVGAGFVCGALAYVTLALISSCAPYARDAIFARVAESTMARQAVESFQHLLNLSMDFHHSKQMGSLTRVVERGVRAIGVLINALLFNLAPTAIEFLLAVGVMIVRLDWRFAVTALAGVALYMLITHFSSGWRTAHMRRQNAADAHAAGLLNDALVNYETVKIFGAEQRVVDQYRRAMQGHVDAAVKSSKSQSMLSTAQHSVMRISLAIIVTMAGLAVVDGQMRVGDVFTAILLLRGLFYPLGMLGYYYRESQQAVIDMEQLQALNATLPGIRDDGTHALARPPGSGAAIRFDNVSYQHDNREAGGLRNVSLDIAAGSMVALVGPSGAGKTTLIRLLARLIEPQAGDIRIDAVDLRALTQASLRRTVALVPQDVALFNDTLFANIAFARPDASEEEVRGAALAAELGPLIDGLPLGMDTLVGERGLKLSGGERQRVGIARALLANPSILILDEATSALDGPTEAAIQATLARVKAGRTTVAIAHRLSTIVDADQIFVVQHGRIVERGNHADLLKLDGVYADLWRRQTRDGERTAGTPVELAPGGAAVA